MSLKVFDLECEHGHVFEGWFSSRDSYEEQLQRGVLCCPVCDSRQVNRKLSAPRINVGVQQADPPRAGKGLPVPSQQTAMSGAAQGELMAQLRALIRQSDNVGDQFAAEARRIHDGQSHPRSIRGQATLQQYKELAEDGIIAMPIPDFLDDDRLQ
ncbi:MAG TPA: DUF1178 family protein [Alcaligenes sp.]|nr:DUF1178 family protein [Alcaligenes sp.]HRL26892.1 DUF1178 family protein [Alcaligenes sp.]